jgi:hypothetical protein
VNNIQLPQALPVHAFFSMTQGTEVGDGANTLFWTDIWLHGQRIADVARHLFALVSKRRANTRTVLFFRKAARALPDFY